MDLANHKFIVFSEEHYNPWGLLEVWVKKE